MSSMRIRLAGKDAHQIILIHPADLEPEGPGLDAPEARLFEQVGDVPRKAADLPASADPGICREEYPPCLSLCALGEGKARARRGRVGGRELGRQDGGVDAAAEGEEELVQLHPEIRQEDLDRRG